MTARDRLLAAIGKLIAQCDLVKEEAQREGDSWTAHTVDMLIAAVTHVAQEAEKDRMLRGG